MKQNTLKSKHTFEGRGLHTGKYARMTVCPAETGTGIVFIRTDIGRNAVIPALAENISSTARSTTISCGGASVSTIEHIMSALTGLGVDNAIVEIDGEEVPILDGSARLYVEAFLQDGLVSQDADRVWLTIPHEIEVNDPKSGAYVRITPADAASIDLTVDFNSRVLGVQSSHWDCDTDYAAELGSCRTFVFFHEIAFLAQQGLVKGGDIDNAIVIVEHPVTDEQVEQVCTLLDKPRLTVTSDGYLDNVRLRFPDECGRHKLLDLIGDMRLAGGYLLAKITAFKSGHTINSLATKAIREAIR